MMHDPSLAPPRPGQIARQTAVGRRSIGDPIRAAPAMPPVSACPASREALRQRAPGAYREVVGGGDAALEAALDVYVGDLFRLHAEVADLRAALKLIRSYCGHAWLREVADHALTSCPAELRAHLPVWLFDPNLARCAEDEAEQ